MTWGMLVVIASAPLAPVENMPEEWDWRKYGILTEPRNQVITIGIDWVIPITHCANTYLFRAHAARVGVSRPRLSLRVYFIFIFLCVTSINQLLSGHNMKKQIAEGKFDPQNQIMISEQNLIDCSSDFGTIGCDGGLCCKQIITLLN